MGIAPAIPQLYCSEAQNSDLQVTLLVKTQGEPAALLPSVRSAIRSIDPQLPTFAVRTMDEAVSASLGRQRLAATLVGGFSLLALFLAALGLYGVLAYSVTQRTRKSESELPSVRRAETFSPRSSPGDDHGRYWNRRRTYARSRLRPFVSTLCLWRRAARPSYDIRATIVLAGVALLACWIPARRAIGVDPMVALRHE